MKANAKQSQTTTKTGSGNGSSAGSLGLTPAPAAPPATKVIEVEFRPHPTKGETKSCFRFEEVTSGGQPPKITTLYIQKWALDNRMPAKLIVKLEVPQ